MVNKDDIVGYGTALYLRDPDFANMVEEIKNETIDIIAKKLIAKISKVSSKVKFIATFIQKRFSADQDQPLLIYSNWYLTLLSLDDEYVVINNRKVTSRIKISKYADILEPRIIIDVPDKVIDLFFNESTYPIAESILLNSFKDSDLYDDSLKHSVLIGHQYQEVPF